MLRSVFVCMFSLSAMVGVFAFAPAAFADQGAQPADIGPAPKPAEPKICRRVESTGPRAIEERVCKTAAEWDADERANQARGKDVKKKK